MAYNENLADRIRELLAHRNELKEKKMFGGLSFMLDGNMCCGIIKDDLVVRVNRDRYENSNSQSTRATNGFHRSSAQRNGVCWP